MRIRFPSRVSRIVACLGLLALALRAQANAPAVPAGTNSSTSLIMPFSGHAIQPRLLWLGESFAVGLRQVLRGSAVPVLGRREMRRAFNREGIPDVPTLSHATLMSVTGNVDARWLVVGSYKFLDQKLTVQADVIDLRRNRLHRFTVSPQPLDRLQWVQARLGWKILAYMRRPSSAAPCSMANSAVSPAAGSAPRPCAAALPDFASFWRRQPPVALPAYESYIRGLLASPAPLRRQYYAAAVQLQPGYGAAMYRLGLWYFHRGQYDGALRWLPRVRPRDPHYWRAQFWSGFSALELNQNLRAAEFFSEIAAALPLPEVLNNWALAASRLGRPDATALLQRALQAAGGYAGTRRKIWANLAAYSCRQNQPAQALAWLQKLAGPALSPTPGASTATPDDPWRQALQQLSQNPPPSAPRLQQIAAGLEQPSRRFPLRRFQQMEAVMVEFAIRKIQALPAALQASRLLEQARQLRHAGALSGARREYAYVLALPGLSPADGAQAHASLGQIYALRRQWRRARRAAQAALQLAPSPAAHRVLAAADRAAGDQRAANYELRLAQTQP